MTHPQYPSLDPAKVVTMPRHNNAIPPERPRVPRQHTRRGKAGYVGDVEIYEPTAPKLAIVDAQRDAEARVVGGQGAVIVEMIRHHAPAIDSWAAAGGDVHELADFLGAMIGAMTQPGSPSFGEIRDVVGNVIGSPDWDEPIEGVGAGEHALTWADAFDLVSEARAMGVDVAPIVRSIGEILDPPAPLAVVGAIASGDAGEIIGGREPAGGSDSVASDDDEKAEPEEKEAGKPHDKERRGRRTKGE